MEQIYQARRTEIRTCIVNLEVNYTQAEIADLLTAKSQTAFYAKDINLLKNLKNTRWKGKAKEEKLIICLNGLKAVWEDVKSQQNRKTGNISPIDEEKIFTTIKNALAAEFNVYKNIPNTKAAIKKLDVYFCKENNAFQNIQNIVKRAMARQWTIQDPYNPSYFELLDIEIQRKNGNSVFVKTQEHWFLKWYSFKVKAYDYIYDNTNEQLYVLEKRNDTWFILSNVYSSPNNTVPPVGEFTNHYLYLEEGKDDAVSKDEEK